MPELVHNAGHAAFFLLLDLVDAVPGDTSAKGQQVHDKVVQGAVDSLWNVVNDTGLEPDLAVEQQKRRKSGIKHHGCGRCEGGGHQWNHANSNKPLGGPVQRAVSFEWLGRHVCVVDGANNVSWGLRNGLEATGKRRFEERCRSRQSQRETDTSDERHDKFGYVFVKKCGTRKSGETWGEI